MLTRGSSLFYVLKDAAITFSYFPSKTGSGKFLAVKF